MRHEECSFNTCGCIGVIISIVFGAIIGILFAFNFIPGIETAIWIAFGLGILSLILLVTGIFLGGATGPNALSKCLASNTACFLAGIIGTIIFTLAALSIVLVHSILVIILIAITAFFFTLMLIGLISLISCVACRIGRG